MKNNPMAATIPQPMMPTDIGNTLLQPISSSNNQNHLSGASAAVRTPFNNTNNNNGNTKVPAAAPPLVGSTWSDNLKSGQLNIDWDNLLASKSSKTVPGNSPSMNTLKAQIAPNHTSLMKASPLATMNNSKPMAANNFSNNTMMMIPGNGGSVGGMVGSSSAQVMAKPMQPMIGGPGMLNAPFIMDNNNLKNSNNNNGNIQSLDFLQ